MNETKNLIPVGKYMGKVVDYGIVKREGHSTLELQVMFEMDVPGQGKRKLTCYKYFSEKGRKYALQLLAILKLQGNDPAVLIDHHYGSGKLDEKGFYEIEVIQESYNGKVTNKIGWVNDPTSVGVAKPTTGEAQSLKSQLGDLRGSMLQARKEINATDPNDQDPLL